MSCCACLNLRYTWKFDISAEHQNRDCEREKGRVREQFPSRLFIKGVCAAMVPRWHSLLTPDIVDGKKNFFKNGEKKFSER